MRRDVLRDDIARRLDGRRLVWFGTRGDDVESATDLDELAAAFSLIGRYRRRSSVESMALEDLTGERVDLDTYDLDDHPREAAVVELRHSLLRALARPSAVFTYRPTSFLSGVTFARRDRCLYLGMFKDHQAAFEHKPWVETAVAALGLPHVPWSYISDEDLLDTRRMLDLGPVVLRRSRTTGGVGLTRLDDDSHLEGAWPDEDDAFVSVAPFIDGTPVNVSGVVWNDGVTVHPASIQLIGIETCSIRPFGYCGNDFGAARDLESTRLNEIDLATKEIGGWLREYGYRGAFGVDFLVTVDTALFTEVNPRMQGSTHLSCQLSAEAGESCLLLEHLAALLGLPCPASVPLERQAAECGWLAHLVVHWSGEDGSVNPVQLTESLNAEPATARVDVMTSPQLITRRGGTVARVTVRDRLTKSGYSLCEPWATLAHQWTIGHHASSRGSQVL